MSPTSYRTAPPRVTRDTDCNTPRQGSPHTPAPFDNGRSTPSPREALLAAAHGPANRNAMRVQAHHPVTVMKKLASVAADEPLKHNTVTENTPVAGVNCRELTPQIRKPVPTVTEPGVIETI